MTDDQGPNQSGITKELLREDVLEVMSSLSDIQRSVLRLRFGLDDGKQRTLAEVGLQLNKSREQVRQIESAALWLLRRPVRKCTFCGATEPAAKRVFKGQAATICLNCVREVNDFFKNEQPDPATHNHVCYFCNATQSEAGHLFCTPKANVCPRCINFYLDQS